MRLPVLLAVAALALAGCNANQTPNASAQAPSIYWSPAGGGPTLCRQPASTLAVIDQRRTPSLGGQRALGGRAER